MSDVKWIQIVTDIFDNWKVKQIKSMPEGHTMVCVWFEMLCLAGKQNENGCISFSGKLVTTEELLATIFNEDIKIIQMSLSIFESMGMITIADDDIQISNWCEYQNTDGLDKIREQGRERQKRFRAKQKALYIEETSNVTVALPVTQSSISISNSIDSSTSSFISNVKEIIDYLNISINSNYRYNSTKTQGFIKARLNEGFTVDDFKMVIDKKSKEWLGTDMEKYLRPETLFGTKFESYLNQSDAKPVRKNGQRDLFAELEMCE